MAEKSTLTRTDRVIAFCSLWIARLVLSVLAVAGALHLTAGIDPMIRYPLAVLFVAFLLKETL